MVNAFAPVKGKCNWWREIPNEEDLYSFRIKAPERRIDCTCFVEGHRWMATQAGVPQDCPKARMCRYYIKNA